MFSVRMSLSYRLSLPWHGRGRDPAAGEFPRRGSGPTNARIDRHAVRHFGAGDCRCRHSVQLHRYGRRCQRRHSRLQRHGQLHHDRPKHERGISFPSQFTFTGGSSQELFSATLVSTGTQTITGGGRIFGTSNAITVTSATPSTVVVSGPNAVTAGIAFGVTVSVEDQYGNLASSYAARPLHRWRQRRDLPANYTFTSTDAGKHAFTNGVTLSTAAGSPSGTNETITATDTVNGSLTASVIVDDYVISPFTAGDIVVEQINAANNAVPATTSSKPCLPGGISHDGIAVERRGNVARLGSGRERID